MSQRPVSVVIPAHNEGAVIGRCLDHLTRDVEVGEIDVVVVCNGCTDDTAEVASRYAPHVRVLDSPIPSKNAALNLGDENARGFPRFFVDADIVLPASELRKVADVLRGGRIHGAAPRMRVDLAGRSWPIRAYYSVWLETPYVNEGMLGCGVYAVSEAGRSRFDRFPDIIADDCFVRLQFAPSERESVADAWFLMTPPETLHSLIHINVRRQVGIDEMAELHPEVTEEEGRGQRRVLVRMAADPRRWPALGIYLYAKLMTLAIYRWKLFRGRDKEWNRDETSRRAS